MSHVATGSTHPRTSKLAQLTDAVRKSWIEARFTDRQLMEMRTNLSRHAG